MPTGHRPAAYTPWNKLTISSTRTIQKAVEEAVESYRRAVATEDTPDTNLRLAQFLQRTARVAEAEQVLRRVDAQRPAQPTALPDFELIAGKPDTALRR